MEEFNALFEGEDFAGAEELLEQALGASPQHPAFLHFQLGRLYSRWNKMSSALSHLTRAIELAQQLKDEILLVQVTEEFRQARHRQLSQLP